MLLNLISNLKDKSTPDLSNEKKISGTENSSSKFKIFINYYEEIATTKSLEKLVYLNRKTKSLETLKAKKNKALCPGPSKIRKLKCLFIYLIILNIIDPVFSTYNISIITKEMNKLAFYPILNTRYIGKPLEIYITY